MMSDRGSKGKPNRTMKTISGLIILCLIAGAVIFAALLFFPVLFIFLLGLPLWVWVRNRRGRERGGAGRENETVVRKSRYTVLEGEQGSDPDRDTGGGEDEQ